MESSKAATTLKTRDQEEEMRSSERSVHLPGGPYTGREGTMEEAAKVGSGDAPRSREKKT